MSSSPRWRDPLLAPNTHYWVSVANLSGNFDWNITTSTANFGSGASFDNLSRESGNGGTTWTGTGVAGEYHQFAVFGTLSAPGNVDTAFGADGKGTGGLIYSVTVQADGKILLGGDFTTVSDANGTHNLGNIARLENGAAISQRSVPDLTRVRWLRGGTAPESSRVTVEVSTNNGASYALLGNASRIAGGWELAGVKIPAICLLRVRAIVHNGGTGSGIVETVSQVTRTQSPVLTLRGKSKLTTSQSRLTLRGTASDPDADLVSVRYIDSRQKGKRWRTARGSASWSASVVLKAGRNSIQIQALDSRKVGSTIKRVTVKKG